MASGASLEGTVKRMAEVKTDGGQETVPQVVMKDWRFKLRPLSGRESERVHATFPEATHEIKGEAEPRIPFTTRDWVEFTAPDGSTRKVYFADVQDPKSNGTSLVIICGERAR